MGLGVKEFHKNITRLKSSNPVLKRDYFLLDLNYLVIFNEGVT